MRAGLLKSRSRIRQRDARAPKQAAMPRNLRGIALAGQSIWDEAQGLWDEFIWRWDYRSAFNLICPAVFADARDNCGSKSVARRLA